MFWQLMFTGLSLGSIYALIALGLVLIFKGTEVVNFAQGELMMIGAYVAFTLIVIYRVPIVLSLIITCLFMALVGAIIERLIIKRMIGEPIFATIMVTFGLGFVLRALVGMIWTYDDRVFPPVFSGHTMTLFGVQMAPNYIWIIIITLFLVFSLSLFFKFTRLGTSMRAVSQNQLAAYLVGISVEKIFVLLFVISSVIAAIAGILVAPILFLHPDMGFVVLKAFPAAILGGFGSIPGAILGGFIIGISENMAGGYLGPWLKDIFAYILLIGILMVRPEGIFGTEVKKRV